MEATDALWRAHANNRLAASSICKRDKAEAEGYESPKSDDDWFVRDDSVHVLRLIRRTMRGLEEEMLLPDGILQKSVAVLNCEAVFEEADDPRTVSRLSRIYFPPDPCISTFICCTIAACASTTSNGASVWDANSIIAPRDSGQRRKNPWRWRSIAWATWDDLGGRNYGQRRVEQRSCDLYDEGVMDLHKALFGALPESDVARRQALMNVVRVLLAAAGIDYEIVYEEGEEDHPPSRESKKGHLIWTSCGLSDRWIPGVEEEAGKKEKGLVQENMGSRKNTTMQAASCVKWGGQHRRWPSQSALAGGLVQLRHPFKFED
ncbi:hypothetical protein GGX14DRAFT_612032 [Mycena pura]|uniref:Uncharacterized protein n=1 Tax=Mycena pura TaxID=153505 RepID=A0AAD7E4E5_9AGAR|nr:hypothetical protein GGX14DRAFT_612032 [Mycena pura]